MKKNLLLLVVLLLSLSCKGQSIYGRNTQTGLIFGANYFVANFILIGSQPVNVTNCFIYIGASGTTGKQAECVITLATNANQFNGTVTCHGTYTFPSGTLNAWETVPMPNCQLAAKTFYFLGYNSNDTAMTFGLTTNCNLQTCLGSVTGEYQGIGTAQYASNACCTYPYGTTTFQGYNNGPPAYGQSVYITTTPVTTTSVQGLRKGSFQ